MVKIGPSKMRSRCYQFTAYKNLEFNLYKTIFNEYNDLIRFLVGGYEICPKSKRKHIQGFIQFYQTTRGTRVQKLLRDKLHIETMYSDEFSNNKYCKKDGLFFSHGKLTTQGKRPDLDVLWLMAKDLNVRFYNLKLEMPSLYSRYRNGVIDVRNAIIEKTAFTIGFRKIKVTMILGDAGVGKSRYVMDKYGYDNVYKLNRPPTKVLRFCGYDGHKVLLIDDFYGWIRYNTMLDLLDGYPYKLDVKFGSTYALFDKIYITSNCSPKLWYCNLKLTRNFRRRFTHFLKLGLARSGPGSNTMKSLDIKHPIWKEEIRYDESSSSDDDF